MLSAQYHGEIAYIS